MNEDRVITMLLDHEERLIRIEETMATKQDIRELAGTLDQVLTIVKKTDQELTFIGERVGRLEYDMARVKPLVGLA